MAARFESLTANTVQALTVQAQALVGVQLQLQAFANFGAINTAYPNPATAKGLLVVCDSPSGLFFCNGTIWEPVDKSLYQASAFGSAALNIVEATNPSWLAIGSYTAGRSYTEGLAIDLANGYISANTTDDLGTYRVWVSLQARANAAGNTGTFFIAVGTWDQTVMDVVAQQAFDPAPAIGSTVALSGSSTIVLTATGVPKSIALFARYVGSDAIPNATFVTSSYSIAVQRID